VPVLGLEHRQPIRVGIAHARGHDRDFDRVDLDDIARAVTAARVSRRTRVAEVLCVGGGAALLVSAFTHWVRRGPGSRLRGHELVDTLVALGRDLPGLSSARLTVLWYLVPALGAASWISVGLTGPASRWTRSVAIAAVIVSVLALFAFARLAGWRDLGVGAPLAVGGAAALLTGTFFQPRA
jgi:hypothetical protein